MIAASKNVPVQPGVMVFCYSLFILAGSVFMFIFLIRPLALSFSARQWMAVSCRVLSSEAKSHPGYHTSYSEEIIYTYKVAGKAYRSDRYRFFSTGGKAKEAVARYAPGSKVVCYVNPQCPSEAVLDRGIGSGSWVVGMIGLVGMGVGGGGVLRTLRSKRKQTVGGAPGSENTDQPWLLRPDWAAGRIPSSTKKGMILLWCFAGIWNLFCTTIAGVLLSQKASEIARGNYALLLVLLFPLFGVGIIFLAVIQTRRWLRFGESAFEMACVPGGIGGMLAGTIRPSRPFQVQGSVKVRLSCIARTTTSSGSDGNSTNERVLWQHEEAVEMSAEGTIPAAFYIPEDCSETTTVDASDGTLWRLEAKAETSGANYEVQFDVPVFRVEQSPQQRAVTEQLLAHEQAEVAAYVPPPTSRIRVQASLWGGTEFYFPACRNLAATLFLTAFLAIWSGFIWFMILKGAPLLFPIVFGFFDVLMLVAAAYAWTGTTRVLVNPAGAAMTSTVLGFSFKKAIPAQDIESIKPKIGMTSGTTVYHDIKIHCRNGKEISAGSAIKDALEAEWLAAQMTKALAGK